MAKAVDRELYRELRKQGLKGKELLGAARREAEVVAAVPASEVSVPIETVKIAKKRKSK